MLGAAQADAGGAKGVGYLGIKRAVGVGADFQAFVLVSERHQGPKVATQFGVLGVDLAHIDLTGGAVEGYPVALVVDHIAHGHGAGFQVHVYRARTGHAALAHAARHYGRV